VLGGPWRTGRLPQHWGGDAADVARFRPARFAEAEAAGDALDAFMPFGRGPHKCLGIRSGRVHPAHSAPPLVMRTPRVNDCNRQSITNADYNDYNDSSTPHRL